MSRPSSRPGPLTLIEYLMLEETSPIKHEFVAGEMYAMSGTTPRHNLICSNILVALRAAASGGPCRVYIADVKLQTPDGRIYYPDVMAVCGAGQEEELIQSSPCLIVEVASKGTERIDRFEKLNAYQQIRELQTYLIVDQNRRRVDHYFRDDQSVWQQLDHWSPRIPIPCLGTDLAFDAIYEGIAAK